MKKEEMTQEEMLAYIESVEVRSTYIINAMNLELDPNPWESK